MFMNQGKLYEIFAKKISQSNIHGFIQVEELKFGQTSSLVIDPQEEKIRSEFDGVSTTYIPVHLVLRMDKVEKEGVSKISPLTDKSDNVMMFPSSEFLKNDPPKD